MACLFMDIQSSCTQACFNTVDEEVNTPAAMIINKEGNLIFTGYAHYSLVNGPSPLTKIEEKTIRYVLAEPHVKVTESAKQAIEHHKTLVEIKCWVFPDGRYGAMRHDYFWFCVDVSTWQSLLENFLFPVWNTPYNCQAAIIDEFNCPPHNEPPKRSASEAFSSKNPYFVN